MADPRDFSALFPTALSIPWPLCRLLTRRDKVNALGISMFDSAFQVALS